MKNKANLIDVQIPEYWIETAHDYHTFRNLEYHYNKIGIKVEHKELGFYGGYYNAVFWIGKKPTKFIEENKIED